MVELTPEANRAARALLRWSIRDLAHEVGIAFSTVHRFEKTGDCSNATASKIVEAFLDHGVLVISDEDATGAKIFYGD